MYVNIIDAVFKVMTDQLAIYNATLACHQVFRDLGAVPGLEEWAENRLADFNLWANGAGALKVGKASLDARLSSNPDARIFVVNLLKMLQGFVEKCGEIGSEILPETPETSELSQAIQDVNDIMGQLSRITISIRKAGTNARIQKADASYDPDHPQIDALSRHLQLLLLVKPNENGSLLARASSKGVRVFSCTEDTTGIDSHSLTAIQQRLIKANLKRRNRFLYAQRHALKLSERDQAPSTLTALPRKISQPLVLNDLKKATGELGVPKVFSATTATEVQDPITLPTQASAQPATTVISAISSRVTYPRPPPLTSDQKVFQCPCCCQTLSVSMSTGSQWKKHLSRDIQPYTCILEDCPTPEELYHTKSLWLSHMFTDHGGILRWACLACNDSSASPVFYEESAFIKHLQGKHAPGIKPQQIPMLVSAWQRKAPVSIHSCPLCGFEDRDSDAVLNHTAEHLHSFSLRSLPWASGGNEPEDDLHDGYYKENPYFDTERSVGTESERSRSTMSSEQKSLEELPAIYLSVEKTENNRLTEEKIREIAKNPNIEKDMLDEFLNSVENQESFQEPSPLASVNNNGSVLGSQDDSQDKYGEAEAMHRRELEELEKTLGPEHPDTLTSIKSLGSVLAGLGQYKEAETMYRRTLEGYEKILGPEHPDTLVSIKSLGSVLVNLGQYEEAETMLRQALKGYEKVLGPKHPDTLGIMDILAFAYWNKRQWKESEELEIQIIKIKKEVLGLEHHDTLASMESLTQTYVSTEQWKEAEELEMQVMEVRRKVLGPKHPNTLASMASVGSIYSEQQKWEEAEKLEIQVLEIRKKVLGPEHPDTLSSMVNLAITYENQGQWKKAEELWRPAMEIGKRVLGPEHPDTLTSMNNLAFTLKRLGNTLEALTLMETWAEIREKVLGPDDPDTKESFEIISGWKSTLSSSAEEQTQHISKENPQNFPIHDNSSQHE